SVDAVDEGGRPMDTPFTSTFRTDRVPNGMPATIWNSSAQPLIEATDDGGAVEVGVRFVADVSGSVAGVRFYKGPGNQGPHVGRLWAVDGTLLATASFTEESGRGWQQALFPEPVAVDAGAVLVASYHAPTGHYACTPGGL